MTDEFFNNDIDNNDDDFFAGEESVSDTADFDQIDLDEKSTATTSSIGGLDVSNIQSAWVGIAVEIMLKGVQIWYTRTFNKSLSSEDTSSLRLAMINAALGNNMAVNRAVMGRLSTGISVSAGVGVVSTTIPFGVPSSTYASKSDKGTKSLIDIFKSHPDWKIHIAYSGNAKSQVVNCLVHVAKKRTFIDSYMCTDCKKWKDKDKNNNIRRVFQYVVRGKMANAKAFMTKGTVSKFIKVFKEFPEILQAFIWPTEWIYANDLKILGNDRIVLLNTSGAKMSNPEDSEIAKSYAKTLFPQRNFYIQRSIARRWPTTGLRNETNNTITRLYKEALRTINSTLRSKGVATISGAEDLESEDIGEEEDDLFAGGNEDDDVDFFTEDIPIKSKEPVSTIKDIDEDVLEEDLFGDEEEVEEEEVEDVLDKDLFGDEEEVEEEPDFDVEEPDFDDF